MLVNPNGSKYWRFRYRFAGRQNTLSYGVFPSVPVEQARALRDEYREMLKQGLDSSAVKQAGKQATAEELARQSMPVRFSIGDDGALSLNLGAKRLAQTPAETKELRIFLDSTRSVQIKESA